MDLDWVLGVIADGPTKTFAFRRLKYLTNKWNMYSLLNENQEVTDIQVCLRLAHCLVLIWLEQSVPHRSVEVK